MKNTTKKNKLFDKAVYIVLILFTIITPTIYLPGQIYYQRKTPANIEGQGKYCDLTFFYENHEDYIIDGYNNYKLHATFIPCSENTDKFVILVHGNTSQRFSQLHTASIYNKLGYNCIIYDTRSFGDNKKCQITYGDLESKDLMCVIADTREKYPDIKILGLHGESMGASTILTSLQYNPEINFCIVDSPYAKLHTTIEYFYHMNPTVLKIINFFGKIYYRKSIYDYEPIDYVSMATVPIMYIAGTNDHTINYHDSCKLYNKTPSPKRLILVEGMEHIESSYHDINRYENYITSFLQDNNIH